MLKIRQTAFIKSTLDWRDGPDPELPEIAFVGRSNVGKSSLINCLLNSRNLARVSKQPGKTRTINYFLINEMFYMVDLPGYGFAKVSRKSQDEWRKAIEGYLLNSSNLRCLIVLVDGKVGPKANDLQLLAWLRYHQVPFALVATKIDRLSRGRRPAQLADIRSKLDTRPGEVILPFSATDKTGRDDLLDRIQRILDLPD